MFWLKGEGLEESTSAEELQVFLNADPLMIQFYLQQAAADGYLDKQSATTLNQATRYVLTDLGRKEGGRRFHDEFSHLQKSGHGECSADCSCHQTGDHANCPTHSH